MDDLTHDQISENPRENDENFLVTHLSQDPGWGGQDKISATRALHVVPLDVHAGFSTPEIAQLSLWRINIL